MRLPAIENATLTRVQGAGFTADSDLPATAGSDKWTGSQGAFLSEITERIPVGGASDVVVRRSVVVSDELDVPFAIGDTVTVVNDQGVSVTLTVRRVARTVSPGLAGVVRLVADDG